MKFIKNKINKKNIIFNITIVFILFSMTECKQDEPPLKTIDYNKKITISDIYKISVDSVDKYCFKNDFFLYGTITMDDLQGNIYKEAYLQDETHGINLYHLKTAEFLNADSKVRINLKNVIITNYRGKLELDFNNCENPKNQIIVIETNVPIAPIAITIDSILKDTTKQKYRCKLVNIKEIQFCESDTAFCYATENGISMTNRNIENCAGNKIIVRTSDQCNFADIKLPKGKGNIIGIMTAFESNTDITWQLLISDINKVNMNENRCNTIK